MATLLVLGSKPDPALPAPSDYDALACANASGASAARLGLPTPAFTVISAILTTGSKAPNRLALEALRGLSTGTLWVYPRPIKRGNPWRRLVSYLKTWRGRSLYMRRVLRRLGYRAAAYQFPPLSHFDGVIAALCDHDPAILALSARKRPSTGIMALMVGLADGRWDRFILSGFSFEITHAYADNPLIAERGTASSKHSDTDIAIIRHLVAKFGGIHTTEPVVAERAGVPPWPPAPPAAAAV